MQNITQTLSTNKPYRHQQHLPKLSHVMKKMTNVRVSFLHSHERVSVED